MQLPSQFQIGDEADFIEKTTTPDRVTLYKGTVEAVRFSQSKVYYDLAVKCPHYTTHHRNIDSCDVFNPKEPIGFAINAPVAERTERKISVDERQEILYRATEFALKRGDSLKYCVEEVKAAHDLAHSYTL